jgi:hypothetical protein
VDEKAIAAAGHWLGVRPHEYDVHLTFSTIEQPPDPDRRPEVDYDNAQEFSGVVSMHFEVCLPCTILYNGEGV